MKPILFNTDMVRAILDGRKTETRRLCKLPGTDHIEEDTDGSLIGIYNQYEGCVIDAMAYAPYQPGDVIYVRETFCIGKIDSGEEPDGREAIYVSQCEGEEDYIPKEYVIRHGIGTDGVVWKPSIHMPKEAARIFLRVTDVRVERLQDITEEQVYAEGFQFTPPCLSMVSADGHYCDLDGPCTSSIKYCDMSMGELFGKELWNSTIKKSDLEKYGWNANPWVYVISFERISKEEAMKGETT